MEKMVARLNIERLCKKLYEETDLTKRAILLHLLAEEEARVAESIGSPEEEKK
jgi:hypothetical protein